MTWTLDKSLGHKESLLKFFFYESCELVSGTGQFKVIFSFNK